MNKVITKRHFTAKKIAIIGLLGALTAVLGMTPLGFIPIGPTRATIMHIPVIVGSVLYGPVVGGFVGLIFGIFSIINALMNMTVVSFPFLNPLVSVVPRVLIGIGSFYVYKSIKYIGSKNFKWLLVGIASFIVAYLIYGAYKSFQTENYFSLVINLVLMLTSILTVYFSLKNKSDSLDLVFAAIAGTMINTVGVLSSIYLFYGERFVAALGQDVNSARKIIMGIAITNGIPESIIAVILVTSVANAIKQRKK